MWIKGKVFLLVGVLEVQPDDVVWDAVLVEFTINVSNIFVGDVVPAALMIGNRKLSRKGGIASQVTVGMDNILRSRTEEDEDV